MYVQKDPSLDHFLYIKYVQKITKIFYLNTRRKWNDQKCMFSLNKLNNIH